MAKIDARDIAEYVESCRQDGIEIAKAKNINIDNSSSLSQVITNFNRLESEDAYDPFEDTRPYRAYTDYRWKGAPDLHPIMDSAQPIEKDGVMYYPIYICLERACALQHIYKKGSTSKTQPNYYNSFGGDAYIFSDKPEELVVGTSFIYKWDNTKDFGEEGKKTHWILVYSSTENKLTEQGYCNGRDVIEIIIGNFECNSKYYPNFPHSTNPNAELKSLEYIEYGEKTYVISPFRGSGYYAAPSRLWESISVLNFKGRFSSDENLLVLSDWYKNTNFLIAYIPKEIIESGKITLIGGSQNFSIHSYLIKTLDFNKFSSTGTFTMYKVNDSPCVETIIFPNNLVEIISQGTSYSNGLFNEMPNLKTIIWGNNLKKIPWLEPPIKVENLKLPFGLEEVSISTLNSKTPNLNIEFPETLKILKFRSLYYSKNNYIKIPENLTQLEIYDLIPYGGYVELYNDFDFSNCNFSVFNENVTRPDTWYINLCRWLKDRSNETSNVIILGSYNINKARTLFITFNTNNKKEITQVEEGTESSIDVVTFLSEQLNWTVS